MSDEWVAIPGHKGYYVSPEGRVKNSRGLVLTPTLVSGGLSYTLYDRNTKTSVRLSRLVGEAFCGDYGNHKYPLYVNGDRFDCRASNIKWVPRSKVCAHPYSVNPKK